MVKRILVTGGAGFLAGAIAEDLVERGHTVDVIDDLSVGKRSTVPTGVNTVINGRVNEENLSSLSAKYDLVFHFAAPCTVIQFKDNPIEALSKANEAAYYIRKFCKDGGTPYLVYSSSATWYGSTAADWVPGQGGFQEELPARPDNIYGVSKVAEEAMDSLFPEVKTLALRLAPAYGARERVKGAYSSVPYQFLTGMLKGEAPEIWGDGNQRRDYIYQRDFVNCVRKLVEAGASGAFGLGTGSSVTINELVVTVNTLLGTEIKPIYVEIPGYKYTKALYLDPAKLLSVIGDYRFATIQDGLGDMLRQMR